MTNLFTNIGNIPAMKEFVLKKIAEQLIKIKETDPTELTPNEIEVPFHLLQNCHKLILSKDKLMTETIHVELFELFLSTDFFSINSEIVRLSVVQNYWRYNVFF